MDLGSILGNIASGGLTGLFGALTGLAGSIVTGITNYKMQKMKNEHAEKMADIQLNYMVKESEMKMQITRTEGEVKIEEGELGALKKSLEEALKPVFAESYMSKLMEHWYSAWLGMILMFFFGVVDFMKHLARPALTYYLMIVSTFLTYTCYDIVKKAGGDIITSDQAYQLFNFAMTSMFYLTVTAVTWWFADRRVAKFLMRLNDGNARTGDSSINK